MQNSLVPSIARLGLLTACAIAAVASTASAQTVAMRASLDGLQETPPSGSPATGTAYVFVNRATNTLTYSVQVTGLGSAETASHLHAGAVGVPGPIKFGLPLGNKKTGSLVYMETDEATIVGGGWYFNVHTAVFGGGEIRGQLLRDDNLVFMMADLDGLQETPPSGSPATGTGYAAIDTTTNALTVAVTYDGLGSAETAAHLHAGAVGVPGPIKFGLPLGPTKMATFSYMESDEAALTSGGWYFNIHTAVFGGGEIRGQVLPLTTNPSLFCVGKVNSQGCTPTVATSGFPILSGPDTFTLSATLCINNKNGIFFWGSVPNSAPFLGGTLCVKPPLERTPPQLSGGNPPPNDCSGSYSFLFSHAYAAAEGLAAGSLVHGQFWMRDPAHVDGFGVGFSNAMFFTLLP